MEWLSIGLLSISILLGLLALVASGYVAMSLLKGKSGERDRAKRVYLLRSLPFLIATARFFWSSFPHLKFAFSLFSFFKFQFYLHFSFFYISVFYISVFLLFSFSTFQLGHCSRLGTWQQHPCACLNHRPLDFLDFFFNFFPIKNVPVTFETPVKRER